MTIETEAPVRQRLEGNLHRSLPVQLQVRAAADGQPDDGLLRIQLSASSDTPYLRQSWWDDPWIEVLGHKDGEVDLTRLNGGAAILANHDRYTATGETPLASIGVVERAWLEGGRLMADIVISRREALADLRQDIADGLVRNVSIGYQINERVLIKQAKDGNADEYRVTDWTPFEISLVDIPADAGVGIGRSETAAADAQRQPGYRVHTLTPTRAAGASTQETTMDPETIAPAQENRSAATVPPAPKPADTLAAERERAREIRALGRAHSIPAEQIDNAVDNGVTLDAFRAGILSTLQERGALRPAESPEIGLSRKEAEQFSFLRAMLAVSDPLNAAKIAPFEMECSRAAQDKRGDSRGKDRAAALTIPIDVLSRALPISTDMARVVANQLIQRARARGSDAYRDLNVGTASAGGNTVATELLGSSFIDLLRNRMVLDQLGVTWLRDLNGNIAIPSHTGAASAYWFTEGNAPTESQQTIGQVTLTPKTVGAFTDYTRRLLLQSSIDIEMFVRGDLAAVLAQAIQSAAIEGASNGPTGLLATAGIGSVAGGTNGLAPTYAHIVDLETAVSNANADVGSLAYLTNTKVRGKLRKTEEFASTNGKPVWTSMTGMPGVGDLLGYAAHTTNSVPSDLDKGTSTGVCSAIMFGNWADMLIGMWGGLDIMLDPYALATSGGKRIIALQDCDVQLRRVASFAAMQDALTA